jgi:hypothetical protein
MSMAMNVGMGLGVIVGFGALALDLGYANFARTQVHAAADAAAIAGAISLMNEQETQIVNSAMLWGEGNDVGRLAVVVTSTDVKRGTWDAVNESWTDDANGSDIWARAHTDSATAFLSRIWGTTALDTQAVSVARVLPPTICTVIGVDTAEIGGTGSVFGYDSSVDLDPANSPDPEAGVCSNNVSVDVFGNAVVDANVRPGIGGSVDITGNAQVTGNTNPLPLELDYPDKNFPGGAASWPYPTDIGSTTSVDVAPGTYKITASDLKINAQAQFVVSGPTEIYVNGDVAINGQGFVNTTGNPANLKIFVVGDHDVRVNGGADFYGLIYAPLSDVDVLGNADFYGAIISSDVDFSGTGDIYMDTSLMQDEIKGGIRLVH